MACSSGGCHVAKDEMVSRGGGFESPLSLASLQHWLTRLIESNSSGCADSLEAGFEQQLGACPFRRNYLGDAEARQCFLIFLAGDTRENGRRRIDAADMAHDFAR